MGENVSRLFASVVTLFSPEESLDHAMMVVEKLKNVGFTYQVKDECEVCFNEICEKRETLAEAITNAAFSIADNRSIADEWL